MAVEVVTRTWCDPCLVEHDARTSGRTIEITLDGKRRTVELCESHEAELLKPLADVLDRSGHRVPVVGSPARSRPKLPGEPEPVRTGKQPAGPRELACLVCDAAYASSAGLGNHYAADHGMPKAKTLSVVLRPALPAVWLRGRA